MKNHQVLLTNFEEFANQDYLIIIPSKGRAKEIETVQDMFPAGVLFVHEDEYEEYAKYATCQIITHSKSMGYGQVVNEIFKQCKTHKIRYAAIFDDDKARFSCLVGNRQRNFSPSQIELAVVNGCQVLEDLDENLFLFSTSSSIIKYEQNKPFKVGFSLPQGAMIVRSERIHNFKVGMHYYEDFDWLMEYIKEHRFMVMENRMLCISLGKINEGGCNDFRTSKAEKQARRYIQKKWGQYASFVKNSSGTIRPTCRAERQKKID